MWGALLGLLFGVTGFLRNHRAPPMRISTDEPQVSQMQMPLPAEGLKSPRDLGIWLKRELQIDGNLGRARREPGASRRLGRQEHDSAGAMVGVMIASPGGNVMAEYWVGNNIVSVKRTENTFLAMMTNLHKGVGLSIGWVLLIDTFASSIILRPACCGPS